MRSATVNAESSGLLSREQFRRAVFARGEGRCVFCGQPAVDAHHILERKLFADGGYRLSNGAAVCAAHHWQCETTEIDVDAVRRAAGVTTWPEGWAAGSWDKWGNRTWRSGLRSAGPLIEDTGARRALAAGRVLHLVMPFGYREEGAVPAMQGD